MFYKTCNDCSLLLGYIHIKIVLESYVTQYC